MVAASIMLSTLIAALTADFGWWVLAGPVVLAFADVGADMWAFRQRGELPRPSVRSLMRASSFLLASLIIAAADSSLLAIMMPILGAPAAFVPGRGTRPGICAPI
jgi:hypothetical protein